MQALENRIPPPLVAVIFAVAIWLLASSTSTVEFDQTIKIVAVTLLWVVGTVFSAGGVMAFRRSETTVNPLKPETASSLVTAGIYQVTRNPMYVGFVLFLLAWAAYLGSIWSVGLVVLFMVYIQRFQINPEERAMLKLFGQEYEDYRSKVRRWL